MILYNTHISGSLSVDNNITAVIQSASYALTASHALNSGGVIGTYTVYNLYTQLYVTTPTSNLDVAYCSQSLSYYLGIDGKWRSLKTLG